MAHVREAELADLSAVLNVLDGAALAVEREDVETAIEREDALVAVSERGTVLGALVLDDERIDPVAVRPGRRGQGLGTALVETAMARRDRLVAEFDADVRPFYEALGFEVSQAADTDRFRGVRGSEAAPE